MKCAFFGHRITPPNIKTVLKEIIIEFIDKKGADVFYVGNQGDFDFMVIEVLKEIIKDYPNIRYYVILAYMPEKRQEFDNFDYSATIYPDGLEKTPKRFAISHRNRWMVEEADIIVTYVVCSGGGAAKFKELAEKKNKIVVNIADRIQKN